MSENPVVAKLAGLLRSEAVEVKAAAVVVTRELRLRDKDVVDALCALLDGDIAALKLSALQALGAIGSPRALPRILPLVTASQEGLRRAAADAMAAAGQDAIPLLRERLAGAPPGEKRFLEETLARIGGKEALAELLAGLPPQDFDGARAVVFPLRARLHAASEKDRRHDIAQASRFLGSKNAAASPAAMLAAIKVIGFGADPASVPELLGWAENKKAPLPVREEALIALRLCLAGAHAARHLGDKEMIKVADKVAALAEQAPLPVARVALLALGGLPVSPAAIRRVGALGGHPESERGVLAVAFLSGIDDPAATQALAQALNHAPDRARAEAAAEAVSRRPEAPAALARALLAAPNLERAAMLASLLRPHARKLERGAVRKMLDQASERLLAGGDDPMPLLQVARAADPAATLACVRAAYDKIKRGKDTQRTLSVLLLLTSSPDATALDNFALAAFELLHGRKNDAFDRLARLSDRGFDVAGALFKERALDHEHRYQAGFHFAEQGHALGEEILTAVAEAAGRSKLGKMAKAKLRSAGLAAD